ncbi:hypothetical protein GCM10023148_15330 [Actinokineospora soli]
MAKVQSRAGRVIAGVVLAGTLFGLWVIIRTAVEQQSWASTEGVVQERMRSGKSFEVRVAYTVPGGGEQEAVLSENGPARHPGERVTVRYDLREGRVVDAALADNDEAFWVGGGILAFLAFGTLVMNVIAWLPAPRD